VEDALARGAPGSHASLVLWIGPAVWPHARTLLAAAAGSPRLLRRSVFLNPPDDASRLWAIDLAIRSPAVVAVIADGARLDMRATRRLQLAARTRCARFDEDAATPVSASSLTPPSEPGALCLLARPPTELKTPSAATTRWVVSPTPSNDARRPRWTIELVRCKGLHAGGTLRTATTVGTPSSEHPRHPPPRNSADAAHAITRARHETLRVALGATAGNGSAPPAVAPGRSTFPGDEGTHAIGVFNEGNNFRRGVEWDGATGVVAVSSDVVHRPGHATAAPDAGRRRLRTA